MKAWKSLALTTAYLLLIVTVSAQGLGGAEMTVGESLTTFVTEVLGFPVDDVSEVLIFVVGPIFAFYFFLTNMMTMAFENFEDRIGRDEWDKKEELPTNLKLFSLVTAFITVVTIGRIAPGLILIFGALALILGILMMGGLLTRGGDGGDSGGNGSDGSSGASDDDGNGQDNSSGATRADYIDRIADAGETITSGMRERENQKMEDQRKEALRYFQSDFLGELNNSLGELGNIQSLESDARDQLGDYNKRSGNDFKSAVTRSLHIKEKAQNYETALSADTPGITDYSPGTSNLCTKIEDDIGDNEDIYTLINSLYKQLSRIESEDPISPPLDVFDELMARMGALIKIGHFVHHYPEDMSDIAADADKASALIETASSIGLANSPNNSNLNEASNLASRLDNRESQIMNLISDLEDLAQAEMKFSESEVNSIKNIIQISGDTHTVIEDILSAFNSHYSSGSKISDHKPRIIQSDNLIKNEINQLLNQLESRVSSDKDIEMNNYRKLKELEQKI